MKLNKFFRSAAAVTLAMGTLVAFASAGERTNIVGGEVVRAGDPLASSTVLIVGQIGPDQQYICTGSLIDRDTLVTAAHCVAEDLKAPVDPRNIVLIFGLSAPTSAEEARRTPMTPITGYKYAPGWKGAASGMEKGADTHDIAVIHFDGELPSGYAPATVIDQSVPFAAGAQVTLAGYGRDTVAKNSGNAGAGILRKVSGVTMEGAISQTGTELAVERKAGVSCQGDSGGPAFVEYRGKDYLWGVTSRGDSKCEVGIYTFIPAYADFINQAANELRQERTNVSRNEESGPRDMSASFERQRELDAWALRTAGNMGAALSAEETKTGRPVPDGPRHRRGPSLFV